MWFFCGEGVHFLVRFVFSPSESPSLVSVCGSGALQPVGHTQILGTRYKLYLKVWRKEASVTVKLSSRF